MKETKYGPLTCPDCDETYTLQGEHKCSPSYAELKAQLATTKDHEKIRKGGLAAASMLDDAARKLKDITGEQNIWKAIEQLTTTKAENKRLREERQGDLYAEFGDGKILVLVTDDAKLIFAKQHGTGTIGGKGPLKEGDVYRPSKNDIVFKFKNLESLLVVKEGIEDIEQALKGDS